MLFHFWNSEPFVLAYSLVNARSSPKNGVIPIHKDVQCVY